MRSHPARLYATAVDNDSEYRPSSGRSPGRPERHVNRALSLALLLSLLATWMPASQQAHASTVRRALREPEPAGLVAQATPPSIANGGFEKPSLGNGFQYSPSGASWAFVSAGVSGNSSAFTNGNPAAPEGSQVAFIQGAGAYISQQVSGFQIGTKYVVTFSTAQRGNCCNAGGLDFQVLVDNKSLGTFKPLGTNYVAAAANIFTATAGTHTLKFVGVNSSGGDNTALIDNIQITSVTQPPPVSADNGGFELPVVGNSFQYGPAGTAWMFIGAGIAGNSSAFTNGNPAAPEGGQVAFIQGGGAYVSQMLSSFRAGVNYSVGFKAAQRGNCCNAGGLDIDVYLDSTLLGSFKPAGATYADMSTAPFATTAGPHILKFVGRNTSGGDNTALLDSVSITRITGNEPPTVGLTSPSNNAIYTAPVDVTLTADAADGDGQVTKVEFFQNGTKVGEGYSAPFTHTWAGVSAGSYTLTARATDDSGAQTTSDAVSLTVNPVKGAVAGKITKADGITPVAGASVKVYAGDVIVAAAVSGTTGDYFVEGLDDGTYIVEASVPEYMTKRQGGVAVIRSTITSVNLSLGGAVSYVYDDLGRLAAVVDQAGETAIYNYDAVGNLLSISRSSSAQTAIAAFTPGEGQVGTSVTIRGSGFNTTLGQNAVTFNGVPAVVTAATTTQITTSVPAGAATGAISVTTPSGPATSSSPFKVVSPTAPTITGFAPAVGPVGTTLTVNGTNFESVATNNRVKVNRTGAVITSTSASSLIAKVSNATGSGRVSVTTPSGTAVSSADFYVTPAPYTAANVETYGRMSMNESRPVSITTADKVALLIFDAVAGQSVSVRLTGSDFSGGTATIYRPDGTYLNSTNISTSGDFIDATYLPQTGTYTMMVDPSGTNIGALTLTLYEVVHITDPIIASGAAVPTTVGTPGQNVALTFNGAAGQRVSVGVTGSNYGYVAWDTLEAKILGPSGNVLGSTSLNGSGPNVFIDTVTLPVTGTYRISLDPSGLRTGSATFTLNDVADVTGTITPGGASVTNSNSTPGQNIRLAFQGTAGQKVSVVSSVSGFTSWPRNSILKPDGTPLTSPVNEFIDAVVLPVTGTYTLLCDPIDGTMGTITFTAYNVTDVTGEVIAGGPAVPVSLATPGQNMAMTFQGTAGRKVTLTLTNNSFGFVAFGNTYVKLNNPEGSLLGQVDVNAGSNLIFLDATTLPATGTYTITLDPSGWRTGGFQMSLNEVEDVTGTIAADGVAVTKTTNAPGQNVLLTFDGTAGQKVSLSATASGFSGLPRLYILRPDGSALVGPANNSIGPVTMPANGTYTVFSDPVDIGTGTQTFTLTTVP